MQPSSSQREARKTVLGPGEQEEPDRYEKREGVAAQDPLNFTLFRQTERKYKNRTSALDLSDAFDTRRLEQHSEFNQSQGNAENHTGKLSKMSDVENAIQQLQLDDNAPLFCSRIANKIAQAFTFSPLPDFLVIPGLFSAEEQLTLLKECFFNAMQSPNNSNLNYHYDIPDCNLFREFLLEKNSLPIQSIQSHIDDDVLSEEFLRKARWFTIGYQYDWTTKEYLMEKRNPFPTLIAKISKEIAKYIGHDNYSPESGVINYYQLKSTLMGHVDRSEKNMEAPLISISLGHSCVFLMGGSGREDPVYPFVLHSGDVVIFQRDCRRNYHGVPRIIEETLPEHFQSKESDDAETVAVKKLIENARININIRQVF